MRDGVQGFAHLLDGDHGVALLANDEDLVAHLGIDAATTCVAAQINLEHALVHTDVAHLAAAHAVNQEVGAA